MEKKYIYIIISLIILLAFFNSLLASSKPDGLERVAEDKGFYELAQDSFSFFDGYSLPINHELLSTGLAGLLGIGITSLFLILIGKVLSR